MLKVYYESGNDSVAVSQRNVFLKLEEYIALYKDDSINNDIFLISQVDMVNAIGTLIYKGVIKYDDVCVIVSEFNKQFLFDKEGTLTDSWYDIIPNINY